MKQKVLSDPNVRSVLKKYVFVFMNTRSRENLQLARKYNISAAPTNVIVSSNGQVIGKIRGYQESSNYINWLNNPKVTDNNRFGFRR